MGLGRLIKNSIKGTIKWALSDEANQTKHREDVPMAISSGYASSGKASISESVRGMNFTVYSATGGKVIQFATYDPRTDRHKAELYVVTDKEDLGEELGQIITKESLSR